MSDSLRDSRVEQLRYDAATASTLEEELRALQALVMEVRDDPRARYDYGRALSRTGRDDMAAMEELRRALALDPELDRARVALGTLHHKQGELDRAAAMYESVLARDPGQYRAWLGLGALEADRKDYGAAARAYRKVAKLRKRDARARSGLARSLHALKRYDDAVGQWRAALAIEPDGAPALRGLAQSLGAAGDEAAAEAYQRAVEANPESSSLRKAYAKLLLDAEKPAEAEALLRDGVEACPQAPRIWLALSEFLVSQDRADEAATALREGLVQTAGDEKVRMALVETLCRLERLADAARELRPIAIADPKNAAARRILAAIQACEGQYEEAESTALAALRLESRTPWPRLLLMHVASRPERPMAVAVGDPKMLPTHRGYALTVRGILQLALGNTKRAGELLEEALRAAPETAVPRLGRALVYMARDNMEAAYAELRTAAILEPGSFHVQHLFGEAAFHTGRYEEAGKAFDDALTCDETSDLLRGLTWFCRARAFRKRDMPGEAVQSYQEAQRLAPEYAPSFFACAVALQELGRQDEALRCYERAVGLSPLHAPALAGMGSCLEAVGRAPEAVEAYRAAIKADPRYPLPKYNLAVLVGRAGDPAEVASLLKSYLRLASEAPNADDARRRLSLAQLRASGAVTAPEPMETEEDAVFLHTSDDNMVTGPAGREAPMDPRLRV